MRLDGRHRFFALCGVFFCLAAVEGCGQPAGLSRMPVFGTITTADPATKWNGSINFVPTEGTPGPATTTAVVDGEYQLDESNGPAAGSYRVFIRAPRVKGKDPRRGGADQAKQHPSRTGAAPQKREWTFPVEVPSQEPFRLDFSLE